MLPQDKRGNIQEREELRLICSTSLNFLWFCLFEPIAAIAQG